MAGCCRLGGQRHRTRARRRRTVGDRRPRGPSRGEPRVPVGHRRATSPITPRSPPRRAPARNNTAGVSRFGSDARRGHPVVRTGGCAFSDGRAGSGSGGLKRLVCSSRSLSRWPRCRCRTPARSRTWTCRAAPARRARARPTRTACAQKGFAAVPGIAVMPHQRLLRCASNAHTSAGGNPANQTKARFRWVDLGAIAPTRRHRCADVDVSPSTGAVVLADTVQFGADLMPTGRSTLGEDPCTAD